MNEQIEALSRQWMLLKEAERDATEARREIEDQLFGMVSHRNDGSATTKMGKLSIKITRRTNRKVDADLLQEIAAEQGLTEHLGNLFRWKPDINMTAWKSADPSITTPLLDAITTSEGRPSFSITQGE